MSQSNTRREQVHAIDHLRVAVYEALKEMYADEVVERKPNPDYVDRLASLIYIHGGWA